MTSVSKEQAKRVLTDFFAGLIEVSRKTQKEARIEIKNFGVLHIFKNREIALSQIDESLPVFEQLTAEKILKARNKEREDLSFIDNASAILSKGGGMTYSIKSSAL